MDVRYIPFWASLAFSITTIIAQNFDCTESACFNDGSPAQLDCEWDEWGECNTTCGPGKMFRTYEQEAQNGGEDCEETNNVTDCNVDKPCRYLL